MKDLLGLDLDAIFGGVGTAGAPPASGDDFIKGSREVGAFVKGFLQGFYDSF
ncbi:hypothetical protein [Xanthomonas translucens]|uniref:hypothetical protein n=1 Tax=Xanthomonas campestris pv. translucens TaxID=343 RepID=UPI000A89F15F|nr:hypothetical protein [Xanthomonas translucens]WLA07867.1 hypothetical protein MO328_16070 [Xanthomonas translucens]